MFLKYFCMSVVQGKARATGIAAFNTLGALGGFTGPYLIGALSNRCVVTPCCHIGSLRSMPVFLLFMSFTFSCKLILMTAGGLQRLLHAADVRVGRFQHRRCCHDSQCALSPAAGHAACVKICLMVCAQHSWWCATPVCRMSWLHLQRFPAGSCMCFGVLHCRHQLWRAFIYHVHFASSTDFYWVLSTSHIYMLGAGSACALRLELTRVFFLWKQRISMVCLDSFPGARPCGRAGSV